MSPDDREERRAARETITNYHEQQLRVLLEHVRDALGLDTGELDAFDVDELIHPYKRSARELWKFCGQTNRDMLFAARTLEYRRDHGEQPPDWWEAGEPRRRA
jgi:hypothetical protein